MTRLNGIIRALEAGRPAFLSFAKPGPEEAIALGASDLDGLIIEMEHGTWDSLLLRDTLQYLLSRKHIAQSGSLAPTVTPLVRIPPNGSEMNQWVAKQALDTGVYGVIWPHVATVEQAMNAVSACRYPRPATAPLYHPPGKRGDGPSTASRYWGMGVQDYYARADVWPLAPQGEVLAVLMIESVQAVDNLADILREVPGIGAVLIGEGDLSQDLGAPRQYDHPLVRDAMAQVVDRCRSAGIPVGHPHVTRANVDQVLEQGYRILVTTPSRSFAALERAKARLAE